MRFILKIFVLLFVTAVFAQDPAEDQKEDKKPKKEKQPRVRTGRGTSVLIFRSSGDDFSFTSKNGHEVLPKKGDWALGINASSLLQYVGNSANGETFNASPRFNVTDKSLPTATIYGKYFIADDLAYRGGIDIFAVADRDRFRVDDDSSTNPDDAVFDILDINRLGFTLSAGVEKRKGKSRVQGVYGAEVFVHYTTNNTYEIEYGNAITQSNQFPTSTGFGNPTGVPTPALGSRLIGADFGNTLSWGARAFAGVEYFIAPKMSLGGEFYWGVSHSSTGDTSVTYEAFEGTQNQVVEFSTFTEGNRLLEVGIENASAAINLMFYF